MSLQTLYLEATEKFFRSNKEASDTLELLNTHEALTKNMTIGDVENLLIAAHWRSKLSAKLCGANVGFTVRDWAAKYDVALNSMIINISDLRIIKEFSMDDILPWISWQEFGKHKNVKTWVLTEGRYAVGFNENPSVGWSLCSVRLSLDQFKRAWEHTSGYIDYASIA